MTLRYKIYFTAAGVVLTALLIYSAASHFQITRQEAEIDEAKRAAERIRQTAVGKEMEAAEYKQKIDYLERQLTEIETIRRKQDEELQGIGVNTQRARVGVKHARGVRTNGDATADELCARLAEVGHGCEPPAVSGKR